MTENLEINFGWLPVRIDEACGDIRISPLPEFDQVVQSIAEHKGVESGWIYAPSQQQQSFGQEVRTLPYPSRVFGLPKTHRLTHKAADNLEHLEFLIWALSFIFGIRLTSTDAGFLDATPVQTGELTDFVLSPAAQKRAVVLSERFWQSNINHPSRASLWGSAIHALMLSHGPQLLQFERFNYLYSALDTCFALTAEQVENLSHRRLPHAKRVEWMCEQFSISVPDWAVVSAVGISELASIRNPTVHEGLFMNAPLGFALHGVGKGTNLTLEMKALVCRLLVALLGDPDSEYVRSPINTRQRHNWAPKV